MVRAGYVAPPKTLTLLPNWTRIAATLSGLPGREKTLSVPLSVEMQFTWNPLADRAGRPVRIGRAEMVFKLMPPPPRLPPPESEWADVAISHVPTTSGGGGGEGEGGEGDGSVFELERLLQEAGYTTRLVDSRGGATPAVRALLEKSRAVVCLLSEGTIGARNAEEVDPKRKAEAQVARAAAVEMSPPRPVVPVWRSGESPVASRVFRDLRFVPTMSGKMLSAVQKGIPFGTASMAAVSSQVVAALGRAKVPPTVKVGPGLPPIQVCSLFHFCVLRIGHYALLCTVGLASVLRACALLRC